MARRISFVTALLSYLWLCLTWFDHDIRFFPAEAPPILPALLLLVCVAIFYRPQWGPDERTALAVGLVGVLSRLPFLWGAYGLFSSDAAAQGVMALHILEGKHHPIFLYNWSYVGSIKAHLTAALAFVSGEPVISFALAATLMYGAFAAAIFLLARTVASRSEALVAAAYVIVAPGFLTAWGMGNEGNYVDVMLFGTLMLWLASKWMQDDSDGYSTWFWIGVLGGLAFWTHILATYYLLTVTLVVVAKRLSRKTLTRTACLGGGFLVGDFPGILWNAGNEWLSFRWWSLDAETVEATDRLGRTLAQLQEVGATSLAVLSGYWPRESPPWPAPVWKIGLTLLIPSVMLVFAWRHRSRLREVSPHLMLIGFAFLVIAVFAQSSFGWMTDEPRYLLFLFSVVPVFIGVATFSLWQRHKLMGIALVLLLAGVNLRGDLRYLGVALESDPVNREFVAAIEELGVRHVRSDYHLSYKYVFLSHLRMVWTSELGPAQTEWYFPFRDALDEAEDVALVPRSFRLARRIGRRLDARGITYRREDLLYPVLFELSEPVLPEELR